MKGIATYFIGFEDIASNEIQKITGQNVSHREGALIFPLKDEKDLAKLSYKAHSLQKVMLLLQEFEYEDEESLNKIDVDFSQYLDGKTFRVNCIHDETAELSGMEIAAKVGEFIVNKTGAKANMDNPDIIFLIYIYNCNAYLCIDYSGIDLSKRDYKIYNHPSSLNGSVAYSLLKTAGWKPGKSLLDPMCGSGIIPIEAGLEYAKRSPHSFIKDKLSFTKLIDFDFNSVDEEILENKKTDSKIYCSDYVLASIRATKNNAKIAEIDKIINPTKCDLEWLETKFDEKSIDIIATHPPSVSRHSNVKELNKVYGELFYQAEYILKDDGKVAIISNSSEEIINAAENNKFTLVEKKEVWQRKHRFEVMVFSKSNQKV